MTGAAAALWLGASVWVAGALLCFAARSRSTALRISSLGRGVLIILALRLLLVVTGWTFMPARDGAFLLLLPLGIAPLAPVDLWLVRAPRADVQATLETGCAGLLLPATEVTPGRWTLCARGQVRHAALLPLGGGLTLALLPSARGRGKVSLLINWLAKQYPGPFPRPRIRLARSKQ